MSSLGSFAVWSEGPLTILPVSLDVRKLALSGQYFLHTCVRHRLRFLAYWEGILVMGTSGCMYMWS